MQRTGPAYIYTDAAEAANDWLPFNALTQALKSAYRRKPGISVPFSLKDEEISFDELYTHLQLRSYKGLGDRRRYKDILFYDLGLTTDPETGQPIKVSWIEGVAGTGKTTLMKRLLHEWSKENSSFWSGYQAVLYVPLRHVLPLYEPRNKPYSYDEWLAKYPEWEQLAYGNQLLCPDRLRELRLLLRFQPDQVLLLIDGLDEVETDHPLLRWLLLNPNPGHHSIITTRPVKQPWQLLVDRHIVNQGFNKNGRKHYVNSYFQLLKDQGGDKTAEKDSLIQWMGEHALMDSFMSIPLNCYLICIIAREGELKGNATSAQLYEFLLVQWVKWALIKSKSMRESFDIKVASASDFDITNAIRRNFSTADLIKKSRPWIKNLEAVTLRCIEAGNNATIDGELLYAVIQEQDPSLRHRDIIQRLKELISFGALKSLGLRRYRKEDRFEYAHDAFLDYFSGQAITSIKS